MGKKGWNDDGSKKKKAVEIAPEFTFCTFCEVEVPLNLGKLEIHYNSKPHKNNQALESILLLLATHGITRVDGEKYFYCEEHGVLEAKAKSLMDHIQDHGQIRKLVDEGGDEGFGDHICRVFKQKIWLVDLQSTNDGLNTQLGCLNRVYPPVTLREDSPSSPFLANIRNGIFNKSELTIMKKVASYLEKEGDNVNRSETIQGTRMSAFGMRWGQGDTGWYHHKHTDVHRLALELADFISDRLEKHYPCVFQHLRKIPEVEGFANAEATMGKSPFTSFAVTRDYNVRPHVDPDDYDLGFILWLQEVYVPDDEEVSLFAFPEYRTSFVPRHGDVLCFRANTLYHCTRVLKKQQQLGLAFFQKASLFRHLKKLLDLPPDGIIETTIPGKGKTPAKTIIERRSDFEVKKNTYEKALVEGKLSLSDF